MRRVVKAGVEGVCLHESIRAQLHKAQVAPNPEDVEHVNGEWVGLAGQTNRMAAIVFLYTTAFKDERKLEFMFCSCSIALVALPTRLFKAGN